MNAQYLGNWLGTVFHGKFTGNSIETSFGISIPVQFSELKQTIHLGKRYILSVNSSVDELVYNCTRVIADALVDNYKLIIEEFGSNSILAWPYNCNFNYLEDGQYYLETGFAMEEDEDEFDYHNRTRLNSSRKQIKSSVDKEILEAAVYDGLMEASPHTQDVAVEWFSNEIDMNDFDSVDDLANYIRDRVEDFADANPGIEQDLIDCGLI